jgi:hypothetical protein
MPSNEANELEKRVKIAETRKNAATLQHNYEKSTQTQTLK